MIRVGIGGWQFAPWRGTFYPTDLPQAQELSYASRHLTSIEINATFYRLQKAESFRRWRDETPADFVFSLKAPRYLTHRKSFDDAEPLIARFLDSVIELGPKLGPILWQFPATRRFDEPTLTAFLDLLSAKHGEVSLRHALEAPSKSFAREGVMELLRARGACAALVDDDGYSVTHEVTAPFVYVRLKRCEELEPTGYPASALDHWTQRLRTLSEAESAGAGSTVSKARDCFVYFISGAKVHAPAAAQSLIARLSQTSKAGPIPR